jgi:hypothetical protein
MRLMWLAERSHDLKLTVPVKVLDGDVGPFHCLLCGEKFAV